MKKLTLVFLALLFLLGCTPAPAPEPTVTPLEENLYVHFIDVGQADCTFLKCGDLDILIDAGNGADGADVVSYLTRMGVDDLELVIATHPHEDHIGGMYYVLKNFPIEEIWTNDVKYSSVSDSLDDQIAKLQLKHHVPSPGEVYTFGALTVTVLGPRRTSYNDVNDTSIVVMVSYGTKRFLMTGDMESIAEAELVQAGCDLKADVLKVGHHGSYSSSSYTFLKAVDAAYGFIPVGRNNDYGHPHSAPLNRLISTGVTLFRADTMGNVVAATNGVSLAFFWDMGQTPPGN